MRKSTSRTVLCQICGEKKDLSKVMPAEFIHEPLLGTIRLQHPQWSPYGYVCQIDLDQPRAKYVSVVLEQGKGELSALEQQVTNSLKEQELLSKNINTEIDQQLTLDVRLADKIAEFSGSWGFIITFSGILAVWVAVNSVMLFVKPLYPYPYILLNLVVSCLAAMQAPVIMMSQNRQEARDRLRAEHDYRVNLKAELEIRHLHEKLDYLLMNQR
jgi:uncharacterized membrane protein